MTDNTEALPPLPEPEARFSVDSSGRWKENYSGQGMPMFTIEHMHAYARAALTAAPSAQAEPQVRGSSEVLWRAGAEARNDMMTIGQVIAELRKAKPEAKVYFDFCGVMPTHVHSDRGYYNHAALGWAPSDYWFGQGGLKLEEYPTVATLLNTLERAIAPGAVFTGWKGGDYSYDENTPLHIDNDGESNDTELVRVEDADWRVVLHTARAAIDAAKADK